MLSPDFLPIATLQQTGRVDLNDPIRRQPVAQELLRVRAAQDDLPAVASMQPREETGHRSDQRHRLPAFGNPALQFPRQRQGGFFCDMGVLVAVFQSDQACKRWVA